MTEGDDKNLKATDGKTENDATETMPLPDEGQVEIHNRFERMMLDLMSSGVSDSLRG